MKTDKQGTSICEPGQEQFETFKHGRKTSVQYDYRSRDGELFTTVAPNVTVARDRRDEWLQQRIHENKVKKINDFMKEIEATIIRETSWPIYNGQTNIKYIIASGKEFLIMEMVENNRITLYNIYIPVDPGIEFDSMFDAVREYIKK